MSNLLHIFRLQQVDSRLDQIHNRLAVIRETLENDAEVQQLRKEHAQRQEILQKAERALKESEANSTGQRIKIEQTESSLYGGAVHNPKELQDLQKDVESLKKHFATLEERQLDAMLQHEEATSQHNQTVAALNAAIGRATQRNAHLAGEQNSLTQEAQSLQTQRATIQSGIDEKALATYEQIRTQRRGLAVARVEENACAACGANITLSQQQTARNLITPCPTCGRILYVN